MFWLVPGRAGSRGRHGTISQERSWPVRRRAPVRLASDLPRQAHVRCHPGAQHPWRSMRRRRERGSHGRPGQTSIHLFGGRGSCFSPPFFTHGRRVAREPDTPLLAPSQVGVRDQGSRSCHRNLKPLETRPRYKVCAALRSPSQRRRSGLASPGAPSRDELKPASWPLSRDRQKWEKKDAGRAVDRSRSV